LTREKLVKDVEMEKAEWQIVIDVSSENTHKEADLSEVVAFRSVCKTKVVYMTELTKVQAKRLFKHAMAQMMSYAPGTVGCSTYAEVLGRIEELYPAWVEEFEEAAE